MEIVPLPRVEVEAKMISNDRLYAKFVAASRAPNAALCRAFAVAGTRD